MTTDARFLRGRIRASPPGPARIHDQSQPLVRPALLFQRLAGQREDGHPHCRFRRKGAVQFLKLSALAQRSPCARRALIRPETTWGFACFMLIPAENDLGDPAVPTKPPSAAAILGLDAELVEAGENVNDRAALVKTPSNHCQLGLKAHPKVFVLANRVHPSTGDSAGLVGKQERQGSDARLASSYRSSELALFEP